MCRHYLHFMSFMLNTVTLPLKYYYKNQNIMIPGFLFKLLGATWFGKDES